MKIKKDSIVQPPLLSTIKDFEMFHRVTLPKSFVDFINVYNGAVLDDFVVMVEGKERLVERFLCIMDDPQIIPHVGIYDISVVIAQIEERLTDNEELLGTEIIPFAVVFGGDFLCLDFRNQTSEPSIILWDHNESDELEPVTYFVASSFSKFFALM